ncbi:type VI secretion system tip protein VgrG [Xenorhabdus sp. ZM]|uniref:type VI secretion system Vgr family protein n=1 Tax=Xenorhabdus szentirmaii TaxID=290112 RepID=UPI0019BF3B31|nr:type VI secretion system tip protein VgrG [Xenorhabdus sp. ZM]MBD2805885.1 type VI secretion system tip protein VgrG [Xenorhabdus sp. ZM]
MDLTNILNKAEQGLSRAQNRYRLEIWQCPASLDVLSFRGLETLSQPYQYLIDVTSPDGDIRPEQVLLKEATFTLQPPVLSLGDLIGPTKAVHGVIRNLKRISTSADETRYQFELVPKLQLLSHRERCAIYQNQSVPEIVEQVLRAHELEGTDFEFRLNQAYPTRELVTQWRENDLDFVQRILAEVGIYYRFEMDSRLEREVVIFGDSQQQYQFGMTLPLHNPAGMSDSGTDSVWGIKIGHKVISQSITTNDYNYRDALTPLQSDANVAANDTTTYGDVYRYAEPYREAGDSLEPDAESGAFFARLHHERLLNNQHRVTGMSTSPQLAVGQVLELNGSMPAALQEGVLLTSLASSGSRDKSYRILLQGMPYSETACFRPDLLPRPAISGTLPARVESTEKNDTYAWLDEHGRYRVKVNFDLDGWEQGYAYLWVRLAKPYAGDTYGWHAPLLDGTEVALAFDGGDCDRPYIAYALHDSNHPDHVTDANHTRNVLRTPANNKLRMEDKRGEEHIKLATEYGKSQLNIGHLVDAQGKQRGAGFEVRTDGHGAIRAGKGIFISAHTQAKAQNKVLEMSQPLSQLQQANSEMQALSDAAEQATALASDIKQQLNFAKERLTQLQSAVILASAPQGIALTSGEHLQLAAGENLMVNAGKNADIGVIKNCFIGVGEAFGVFVQKQGMKLVANQGKVEVEAQGDAMSLTSKQTLTITSTEDEIIITTPNKLTLNGGGSYLTMDSNKIEHGSSGDFTLKCASYTVPMSGAEMNSELPGFNQTELAQFERPGGKVFSDEYE